MKILYGVCGDGMGHAMRSAVVARYLASRGHAIQFVSSSGRAGDYMEKRFPGKVVSIAGLSAIVSRNSLQPFTTFGWNLARQVLALPLHAFSALQVTRPDVIISDFDPWSARYAGLTGIPLVAVDNVQFASRCTHPRDVVAQDRQAAAIGYVAMAGMVPGARRYLITTFADAMVRDARTTLHAPIIRDEALRAVPSRLGHVVAYFNDKADHENILRSLRGFPSTSFRLYGVPGIMGTRQEGNVTLCGMGDGFMGDLASSSAVIGGAGFTLISEALFLKKPILALPFGGQFEQILNANYLHRLGYGMRARALDASTLGTFLAMAPLMAGRLSSYEHDRNAELLSSVEQAIQC